MLLLHRATALFYILDQTVDLFIHVFAFKHIIIYFKLYLWSYLCYFLVAVLVLFTI